MDDNLEDTQVGGAYWQTLAHNNWLDGTRAKAKVKGDVLKEIWDRLETENFDYFSLLTLESLQLLER